MEPPKVLTVVFADKTNTYASIVYENEWEPWRRRTVQIELTEEQRKALRPRYLGVMSGRPQYEEIVGVWFEPVDVGNSGGDSDGRGSDH